MSQVLDRSKWVESAFIPYQAVTTSPPGPALVLAPHADDEVLGCAGAIISHLVAGDAVNVVIATDSDYGQFPAGTDGRAERRREAQAAAASLGYGQPIFWGLSDRGLVYDEELIGRVLAVLEASAAAILYAPSWWEIHPDHCVLALAAAEAVRRCPRSMMLILYEVGVPLHPNRMLDLTGLVERKQAALNCYESQLKMQPYDQQIMALHRYRSYTLPASVKFAEAFCMLRQEELQQDPVRAIRPGLYYAQSMPTSGLAQPLVSVLYIGGRAGLAEALDSVMIQTHAHVEVLVIVDRGVDALLQEQDLVPWQGGRFPVRVEVIDGPLSRPQRANLVMASARGDWLTILDDGESLEPDHLARLLELLGRGGRPRCVCAGVRLLRVKPVTQEDTEIPADAGDGADFSG
ncbi:MAG: PIG-L family deacetylase, partial [Chromatiaceae bacterium]